MQQSGKIETTELYRDHNVQILLSKFLSGEIKKLEPVFDSEVGYHYPVVETIVGEASQVEPFFKSFNIQKSSLIEHVKCGYMDLEMNFRDGNTYVCPKCHEELRTIDVDYRKAGIWCTCDSCRKSFDIPVPSHFCRNCRETSTFEEVPVNGVFSYPLKANVAAVASFAWFLVAAIREL